MKLIDCPDCLGKGQTLKYPYYSNPLPPMKMISCWTCQGRGWVYIRTDNYNVIR